MADNTFVIKTIFKGVNQMSAPIVQMQNTLGGFTRRAERNMRELTKTTENYFSKFVKWSKRAAVAGAAFGAALYAGLKPGTEFQQALISAAVKMPGRVRPGTEAFKEMNEAARLVGRTTEFTAIQAAGGLKYLAAAGFDAGQAVASLPGLVHLATSAEIDLAQATDIATDSLGAMGLMTKDTAQLQTNLARVSDVLALTTARTNTNMEQLFETIAIGGSTATSAGSSLETFAAMAGKIANDGIKASMAGTSLRRIFLNLQAPPAAAAKQLKRLGIQTQDSAGNLLDVLDIFEQLENALKNLGTAQRGEVIKDIFGARAVASVNSLLRQGSEELRRFRDELGAANGATLEMASTMRNTVQGSLNGFWSAVESVKISIFQLNQGPLKDVIDSTTKWVRENEKIIAQNVGLVLAEIIQRAPEIVAATGWWLKFAAAIVAVVAVLKTFTGVLTLVNLLIALNPVARAIAGIAALSVAVWGLVEYFVGWRNVMQALFSSFDFIFGPAVTSFKSFLSLMSGDFDGFITGMSDALSAFADRIRSIFAWIKSAGSAALSFVGLGSESASSVPVVSPQDAAQMRQHILNQNDTTNTERIEGLLRVAPADGATVEIEKPFPSGIDVRIDRSGGL